jgi:Fe-S-cluster containining protein
MNSVYHNPEYTRELDDHLKTMEILLFMDPKISYQTIRGQITKITNTNQFKNAITCGSITSCSFCCHDKIIMGKVEAEHVKSVIIDKKISPNKHRVKVQNANNNVKWIDKACPMLLDENENGQRLCSIYEDRPLICRTHNSSMDPNECNKENDPKKTIREAKIAIVDAFSFTSFRLGTKLGTDPTNTLVTMHEMLLDMIE